MVYPKRIFRVFKLSSTVINITSAAVVAVSSFTLIGQKRHGKHIQTVGICVRRDKINAAF